MRHVLIVYDVPSGTRGIKSPPSIFRKVGIPINLSAWIVPDHLIPEPYMNELRGKGANVRTVRFDASEEKEIINLAKEHLEKEVQRVRKSLSERLEEANTMIKEADRLKDGDGLEKAQKYVRWVLGNSRYYVKAAEECAIAFDILGEAKELFKSINKIIAAKAKFYILEAFGEEKIEPKGKKVVPPSRKRKTA